MKVFPLDREKARQQLDRSKSYLFCIWWGSSDQKELWYFSPKSCVSNQALMLCLLRLLILQIFTEMRLFACNSNLDWLRQFPVHKLPPSRSKENCGAMRPAAERRRVVAPRWILWSPHHLTSLVDPLVTTSHRWLLGGSRVAMRDAEDPCQQLTPLDIL